MKKISPDAIPRQEAKKFFLEYVEDYNTATFPHEKYYNIDQWAAKEAAKQAKKAAKHQAHAQAAGPAAVNLMADEERLRQERMQQATAAAQSRQRFSEQQLNELRRLEHERVQADRERKMGIHSRTDLGVRFDKRLRE